MVNVTVLGSIKVLFWSGFIHYLIWRKLMKLFVGNLPKEYTEDDLLQLLTEFGSPKNPKIIKDRDTGQSRGFGFVELESKEEGTAAIEKLNGKEIGGRALTVSEAREQSGGGGGGRGGPRGGGGRGGPPRRGGGGFRH
ncbi:MAG: RNA-binding protein [Simkania sp.]|uniref:Putative RNA-binding protein rbpA n=2 Tax=Simkania negevensis TaxID=83561 RepID=F8L6B2_SIMNZ|nr:RNA-binding protein [Simkania sp.]MCB1083748.1 RNA-binding protein [Simkania sp.]CCB88242.1 putative RNA-binding protein rbpA [Simkania negevensis Z]